MTKKQKKVLFRIILSAVLVLILHFVPVRGLMAFALYMVPYLIIGYDILRKAVKGILKGSVLDENFLMAAATVGAMALALYPVSMKQLMDIADTGNIMPPKTTWFEPKLRSGLIIHKLE